MSIASKYFGLLVLASDDTDIDAAPLEKLYGEEVAGELLQLARTVAAEARSIKDARFSIPIEYKLRFTSKGEEPDVSLVQATEAPVDAVIFEKARDPEVMYPYRTREVEERVADRLGRPFNSHDLQAILFKEKWKQSDNEYHRLQRNPDTSKYSAKAVEAIVTKITDDDGYLDRARASYRSHLAKNAAKGSKPK